MINTYKVTNIEGVEIDGGEFVEGEELELDPEVTDISELLADGSLAVVEAEDEVVEDNTVEDDAVEEVEAPITADESTDEDLVEETVDDMIADVEESGLSYEGKKVVGEVTEEEVEGRVYKCFSVESGETYKLPSDEFDAEVK